MKIVVETTVLAVMVCLAVTGYILVIGGLLLAP